MKKTLTAFLLANIYIITATATAQDHRFDPPWNMPPESKVMFTVPGVVSS